MTQTSAPAYPSNRTQTPSNIERGPQDEVQIARGLRQIFPRAGAAGRIVALCAQCPRPMPPTA
eukprot:4510667-Pyramimonas_sp.AAC.1